MVAIPPRATLVSVAVVGMLFSHTIVFVSAAVLASLGLVAFVRRRWTELGELVEGISGALNSL